MVFITSVEDPPTKLHLLYMQALFLAQATQFWQEKEDHWLLYSSCTVKIFLIAWVQAMGTWETMTQILKSKAITVLHIQIFKGPLLDWMCFKLE